MTNTSPAPNDTPKPPIESEEIDSGRVPDISLDGVEIKPPTSGKGRLTGQLSEEELKAAEEAAKNLSIEDILASDGVDRIGERATGRKVSKPSGFDPASEPGDLQETLERLRQELGADVDEAERRLDEGESTEKRLKDLTERLKRRRTEGGSSDRGDGVEVKREIVEPLVEASKGVGRLVSDMFRRFKDRTRS